MPLRCLDDASRSLDALALTTAEWSALTVSNRRIRHLRMVCCPSPVVLKTSRLGTRFFAHHALGGCASGDETQRRQARYAARGVRALWLFRGAGFVADADTPAVRVRGTLAGGLTILDLPAADFLTAVFDRRLKFGLPIGATAVLTVWGAVATCWGSDCDAQTRGVVEIEIALAGSRCVVDLAEVGGNPEVVAALNLLLPADPLRGRIRIRQAHATAVAGCFRCDRPLTRFASRSRYAVVRAPVTITPAWARMITAQPGYAPVWSVVPVAPAHASA